MLFLGQFLRHRCRFILEGYLSGVAAYISNTLWRVLCELFPSEWLRVGVAYIKTELLAPDEAVMPDLRLGRGQQLSLLNHGVGE